MMLFNNNLDSLDLHGLDREYASILIKDFINDSYKLRKHYILIIHGIGSGILRKKTQEVLSKNRLVKTYRIDPFNPGTTIVELEEKH